MILSTNNPSGVNVYCVVVAVLTSGVCIRAELTAKGTCRLERLERVVIVETGTVPAIVHELKQSVERFKEKLEVISACACLWTSGM